jgi:hypothetical protein
MPDAVRVEGLRELDRAFRLYGRGLEKGVREALEAAAQPVSTDAQSLAISSIPRITLPWSQMRVGVTKRTAYVAPLKRGTGKAKRRQADAFRDRLLTRAMEPALERNIRNVERELGDALDDLGRMWARV